MLSGRVKIISIILLAAAICALFIYQYLINIYEVIVLKEPSALFADNQSQVTVTTVPVNSTGKKAWFRNSSAEFRIIEGTKLVEIVLKDEESGILILKAKNEKGKVVIEVISKYSLLPILVEIPIHPNYT
jgi:hypothetical protein